MRPVRGVLRVVVVRYRRVEKRQRDAAAERAEEDDGAVDDKLKGRSIQSDGGVELKGVS